MSSSTGASRKETERTKLIQEKCQTLLTQMLRDEDNKYCVDCDAKGPRWASWNLGVFLCIRCAGIHRNLGVHISRVKSVNLDTWTPEQVISLQQMGNSRARAVYEAQLPDGFRRPQTDTALESFIRAKYEHKKYLAREWVPPSPPKVDWAKEIDEELEKQKRKKKAAQACSALGLSVGADKKSTTGGTPKTAPLPAPLPKPKPGQSGSSPKPHRFPSAVVNTATIEAQPSNDLLGLSSPTRPLQNNVSLAQDLQNDSFSGFLSAAPIALSAENSTKAEAQVAAISIQQNSLAKEEEDFFNQGSLGGLVGVEKDKSGKLTKDSILALYGQAPSNSVTAAHNPHNPQMAFGQPQPMFPAVGAFAGMAPAYMGGAGGAVPHPQQQQHQFMTPPNSASMYNSPVMTAPTAFTAPGMHMAAAQFPGTAAAHYAAQQLSGGGMPHMMGGAGGIMATGQPQVQVPAAANLNLMHTNQSLLSGMTMMAPPAMMGAGVQPGQMPALGSMNMSLGAMGSMPMTAGTGFQAPGATAATANLNQQFGNLNIGNVWQ